MSRVILFHGLRVGPPCGRAAPPAATTPRPVRAKHDSPYDNHLQKATPERPGPSTEMRGHPPPPPNSPLEYSRCGLRGIVSLVHSPAARGLPKSEATARWGVASVPTRIGDCPRFLEKRHLFASPSCESIDGFQDSACRGLGEFPRLDLVHSAAIDASLGHERCCRYALEGVPYRQGSIWLLPQQPRESAFRVQKEVGIRSCSVGMVHDESERTSRVFGCAPHVGAEKH